MFNYYFVFVMKVYFDTLVGCFNLMYLSHSILTTNRHFRRKLLFCVCLDPFSQMSAWRAFPWAQFHVLMFSFSFRWIC